MRKNKNRISLIILCIIVLLNTIAYGAKVKLPEASQDFYVYDKVGIVNKDIKNYIIDTNKELYKKTGAQVVVAVVDSLEGLDIKHYATSIYEKWEIGSREYDNGMLILISPNDGLIWIEVGYGLEGRFPDSKTKRIIENNIIPFFAEGKYGEGIVTGFNQILSGMEEEYNITITESEDINQLDDWENDGIFFPRVLIIFGIILLIFIDIRYFNGLILYSLFRGSGRGGGPGGYGGSSGRGSSGGGGRSGGGGAGGKW